MDKLIDLINFVVKMLKAFLEYLGVAKGLLDEHFSVPEEASAEAASEA